LICYNTIQTRLCIHVAVDLCACAYMRLCTHAIVCPCACAHLRTHVAGLCLCCNPLGPVSHTGSVPAHCSTDQLPGAPSTVPDCSTMYASLLPFGQLLLARACCVTWCMYTQTFAVCSFGFPGHRLAPMMSHRCISWERLSTYAHIQHMYMHQHVCCLFVHVD